MTHVTTSWIQALHLYYRSSSHNELLLMRGGLFNGALADRWHSLLNTGALLVGRSTDLWGGCVG